MATNFDLPERLDSLGIFALCLGPMENGIKKNMLQPYVAAVTSCSSCNAKSPTQTRTRSQKPSLGSCYNLICTVVQKIFAKILRLMKFHLRTVLIKDVRHHTREMPLQLSATRIVDSKVYYRQSEDIMKIFKTLNLVLQLPLPKLNHIDLRHSLNLWLRLFII